MMKSKPMGKILALIAIVLLAGVLVYFYIALNKLDKLVIETQSAAYNDSGRISAIVNFFNSNLNAQQ